MSLKAFTWRLTVNNAKCRGFSIDCREVVVENRLSESGWTLTGARGNRARDTCRGREGGQRGGDADRADQTALIAEFSDNDDR